MSAIVMVDVTQLTEVFGHVLKQIVKILVIQAVLTIVQVAVVLIAQVVADGQ